MRGLLALLCLLVLGCEGALEGSAGRRGKSPGTAPGANDEPASPDEDAVAEVIETGLNYRFTGTPSPLRRMSRDELRSTVEALVGLTLDREELPTEPRATHEVLKLTGRSFGATDVPRLRDVLTRAVTGTGPGLLLRMGCRASGPSQRSCLSSWASGLAARAWRRALWPEDVTKLEAVLASAGLTTTEDAAVVESVLVAIFSSPSFLYRVERGNSGVLSEVEIASRLSFFATGLPPDAELLLAARARALSRPESRLAHYERLARTPAGLRRHAAHVLEWLGATESTYRFKAQSSRDGLPADFEAQSRASALAAIEGVLGSTKPTVHELLTTTSYLNDAPVLEVTKAGTLAGGVTVGDAPGTRRRGLLMHPWVLAAHTKENGASPFLIGAFLKESLLCERLPPPPADAAAQARQDVPPGASLRESLEFRTTPTATCAGCHAQFAPLGYAFLPFDPVGRWFPKEPTGKAAWQLAGSVPTSWASEPTAFDGPSALVGALAASPQVQGCFGSRLLELAMGRGLVERERGLVKRLDEVAGQTNGDVYALMKAIVGSDEFIRVDPGLQP